MSRRLKKSLSFTSKTIFIFFVIIIFGLTIAYVKKEKILAGVNDLPSLNQKRTASKTSVEILDKTSLEQIINAMTPEEMAGQLMMVGFSGKEPDYYITRMIKLRHVGGVILYSRNIKSAVQVEKLTGELQKMAADNKDLPLFIAVDQEGGEVDRFKGIISTPSPSYLGKIASPDAVESSAQETAERLSALGINVNLAPVMDVAWPKSTMALRAYGRDPLLVAELGAAAIRGYKRGGVIPCAKHFPGLGRAVTDPHQKPVEIAVDLATLEKSDLVPFKRAIEEKVEMMMVSHALYPALDAQNPASFSPTIQYTLLRKTLGYQGLILSDDLEMRAAASRDPVGRLAVEAVKAGADMVLICHTPEKQREAYDALLAAIKSGDIERNRLKESLKRIVYLKRRR